MPFFLFLVVSSTFSKKSVFYYYFWLIDISAIQNMMKSKIWFSFFLCFTTLWKGLSQFPQLKKYYLEENINNGSIVTRKSKYVPIQQYFVPYLLSLKQNHVRNTTFKQRQLEKECIEKPNLLSYFHEIVYDVVCEDGYINGHCNSHSNSLLCAIKSLVLKNIKFSDSKKGFLKMIFYEEIIKKDVPFCRMTICPLIKGGSNLTTKSFFKLSFLDCMPTKCIIGFYIIQCFDITLSVLIATTNSFVVFAGLKHKIFKTPGG